MVLVQEDKFKSLLLLALVFFFTLVTGPRRSLSLKLSDTRVYEPQIRARLGTTALNPEHGVGGHSGQCADGAGARRQVQELLQPALLCPPRVRARRRSREALPL